MPAIAFSLSGMRLASQSSDLLCSAGRRGRLLTKIEISMSSVQLYRYGCRPEIYGSKKGGVGRHEVSNELLMGFKGYKFVGGELNT